MMEKHYAMRDVTRQFMNRVYGWMSAALAVTAGVSLWVASTPALYIPLFQNQLLFFGIVIAQIATVMFLSWKVREMSYAAAITAFTFYAALVGVTCSAVLIVYTYESVATAFFVTSGMFAAMSLYGYFTKADLSSLGNICMMGLWGLMIAGLVNMWFQNDAAQYLLSLVGVGIFTLLTAYDVQMLKDLSLSMADDAEARQKMSILGALNLYLDFINLFLRLVHLFGKRRD